MKPDHKTQRERERERDYTISLIHGLVDAWHLWGSWIWWINRVPLSTENFPSYLQNTFDSVNLMRWPEVSSVPVLSAYSCCYTCSAVWLENIEIFFFILKIPKKKNYKKKKLYFWEPVCIFGNKIISKNFVFIIFFCFCFYLQFLKFHFF